jgi:ABC-type multidrug transport system fused ATPase/permease subunit
MDDASVTVAPPPPHPLRAQIGAGKTVAIVGESGCGKSTVTRLLTRALEAQGGQVLVDGQDVATVTAASLREQIGLVQQEPAIFNEARPAPRPAPAPRPPADAGMRPRRLHARACARNAAAGADARARRGAGQDIGYNIEYAADGASRAAVGEAVRVAQLDAVLAGMPDGAPRPD